MHGGSGRNPFQSLLLLPAFLLETQGWGEGAADVEGNLGRFLQIVKDDSNENSLSSKGEHCMDSQAVV